MADRDDFCSVISDVWLNHGIYLWGGNGELTEKLTVGQIRKHETSEANAARVIRYIALCYDKDLDMSKSRAMDCSGLVIYGLRTVKAISSTEDYTAAQLQSKCKKIQLTNTIDHIGTDTLRPGDLVFNKVTNSSHVGVYAGYDMVIEARGRNYGVDKRTLQEGPWVIGGRLPYFN